MKKTDVMYISIFHCKMHINTKKYIPHTIKQLHTYPQIILYVITTKHHFVISITTMWTYSWKYHLPRFLHGNYNFSNPSFFLGGDHSSSLLVPLVRVLNNAKGSQQNKILFYPWHCFILSHWHRVIWKYWVISEKRYSEAH